ncbi:kelch repeat-containing protein, partial [Archangium gephyra]
LTQARSSHTATLLPGGKVLVAGGQDSSGPLRTVEVYDSRTGQWTTIASLAQARSSHTATLLPGGRVLVAGGQQGLTSLASTEVYDPGTGQWTETSQLAQARSSHTATLLPGGKILVAGGRGASGTPLLGAEVYDLATSQWTPTGSMASARLEHPTATLLAGGQVLLIGGGHASAERYEDLTPREEWRSELHPLEASPTRNGEFRITGSRLRGFSEASSGTAQSSATNLPLVSLMAVEGGAVTYLPPLASSSPFSDTEMTLRMPATVPDGHYILSVVTNAIHSGQMVWVKGPELVAPEVNAPGAFVPQKRPDIQGTAKAGSSVTVWLDGTMLDPVVTDADGNWSLSVASDLEEGGHELKAIAQDEAGNVSPSSEELGFTVDTVRPEAPEVLMPGSAVGTQRPDIGGRAEPESTVTVRLDGQEAGTVRADEKGEWVYRPAGDLAAERHEVSATATDAAGNTSPPSAGYAFIIQKSHYGWSCATAPAFPATWALMVLALSLGRRRRASR